MGVCSVGHAGAVRCNTTIPFGDFAQNGGTLPRRSWHSEQSTHAGTFWATVTCPHASTQPPSTHANGPARTCVAMTIVH